MVRTCVFGNVAAASSEAVFLFGIAVVCFNKWLPRRSCASGLGIAAAGHGEAF
jgi:hypothetical protein